MRELPLREQRLAKVSFLSSSNPAYDGTTKYTETQDLSEANVTTSMVELNGKGEHRVVLDIDMYAKLVPSSTPDHFHLYIDKKMSWPDYLKLITVLGEVGILEPGYVGASIERGFTAVRLPWVKKDGTIVPEADDLL